jgi:hypothetical protein
VRVLLFVDGERTSGCSQVSGLAAASRDGCRSCSDLSGWLGAVQSTIGMNVPQRSDTPT